ncbi:hypothetical protein [Nitrosomonas sp.]|uniref:hypothetical protein n=1 Tax=Nitrosomonas sp. TaxID=42353 RepID=UPI002637977A|nr:hypothetical protein [Nitrosomonas sp.]MCW5600026.1 hypothetical protein [Nitrosomonas sp.]
MCEVIEAAKGRLFLVSFVAYEVDSIIRALRGAIGRPGSDRRVAGVVRQAWRAGNIRFRQGHEGHSPLD